MSLSTPIRVSTTSLSVQDDNGAKLLILPMPLPYVPIPTWVPFFGVDAIAVLPVYIVGSLALRAITKRTPPPRVKVRLSRTRFKLEHVDQSTGEKAVFECDPAKIIELRRNRYENGLWIHVRGKAMQTFMRDIDPATLQAICDKLWAMLAEVGVFPQNVTSDKPQRD